MPDFSVEESNAIFLRGTFLLDRRFVFGEKAGIIRFVGNDIVFYFNNVRPPYEDAESSVCFPSVSECYCIEECIVAYRDFSPMWPECDTLASLVMTMDFIEENYSLITDRHWSRTLQGKWDARYRRKADHSRYRYRPELLDLIPGEWSKSMP